MIITVTASGIPVTVSRLILKQRAAKNPKGEKEVVSAGILTCVVVSLPITLATYFFRDKLSFIFTDARCYDIFLVMAPGITITSVYAVIRGYFWGNRRYLRYSVIELVEEIVMAVAGVVLVSFTSDPFTGAKRAGTAVLISYIVSFVVSSVIFTVENGKLENPLPMLKPLIISSSPITATRTLTSAVGMLVAVFVPSLLVKSGMETSEALAQFGKLSGMAFPMLFIPSTIIGSVALVLVPEISQSFYEKRSAELKNTVKKSLDACTLISVAIIPVFVACGKEIGSFVYDDGEAGVYLAVSAITMLPMSVSMITNSLINSLGKERLTLLNYVVGAAVMLAVVFLTPNFLGVYSLILANFLSFFITSILNVIALKRTVGKIDGYLKNTTFSLISVAASSVFGLLLKGLINDLSDIAIVLGVGAATTVFNAVLLIVFGVLDLKTLFSETFKPRTTQKAERKI